MPIEDTDIERSVKTARAFLEKIAKEMACVQFPKANVINHLPYS